MKKWIYTLFFISVSSLQTITQSPHVITMFLKEYPTLYSLANPDETKKPTVDGIYFSYFGFLNATGHDGDIVFPRYHQDAKFTLLISTDAQPIFMASNTIAFWQLNQNAHYAFYTLEKKQDLETKRWFWEVQKATPPDKARLSVDTLIVFANPDAVYVPEGITLSDSSQQLILPSLYVKGTIERPENTLKAFEVKNFFGSLTMTYNKTKTDVQSQAQ